MQANCSLLVAPRAIAASGTLSLPQTALQNGSLLYIKVTERTEGCPAFDPTPLVWGPQAINAQAPSECCR
jgi:hypothetical protein